MLTNPHFKRYSRILIVFLVVLIAWGARMKAIRALGTDYDEDDYTRAGQEYAALIRSGNWAGFMQTNYRPEHPPLAKIAYGLVFLTQPDLPLVADVPITDPPRFVPPALRQSGRTLAATLGSLTVLLLALVNPLGGLLLAIHTWTIKYTSQVMLDALPALLALGTILAYLQYKQKKQFKWLVFSAVLLGLTADSKFLHAAAGFAILADWFWHSLDEQEVKKFLARAIPWGLLAIAVFFVANPYLWADQLGKIQTTLAAVKATTTSSNVTDANFPFWQQFLWLSFSVPWQPEAFYLRLDSLILILALAGLPRLWKKETVFVFWFGIAACLLMVWKTQWPQYTLVLTAPLCLAAAEGFMTLVGEPLQQWWMRRREKVPRAAVSRLNGPRQAVRWLAPGLVIFFIFTILPLLFQFAVSMTDFSVVSIRDGFQGGLWRAIWGGLTGQLPQVAITPDIPFSNQVNYVGLSSYSGIFRYFIAGSPYGSLLFFNILWTILSVALQTGLGLGIALLLRQRGVRLGKFWQALFILPWAIPEMVGVLMWANIFQPDSGWLALAVKDYGPNIPFGFFNNWFQNTNLSLAVILITAIWYGFPFMLLAASAGLKLVPPDVYDASAIDGANAWQTFRHVTWPLLTPLLLPAIVIRGIFAFNQFYLFQAFPTRFTTLAALSYNLFNPSGGFGGQSGLFAISAVINIITVIILIGFVLLFNRLSKADEGVNYA
jgi:ABC-type sugar transport system permease subunit